MEYNQVENFCSVFYGYGNWNGPWWFLGMEEKGCTHKEEAELRLSIWRKPEDPTLAKLQKEGLADLQSYCKGLGIDLNKMRLPKTWQFLIRLFVSSATSEPVTKEIALHTLAKKWGVIGGPTCLVELQPLPCPKQGEWPWREWCKIETRKSVFEERILPQRCTKMTALRNLHKPRVVVFYGKGFESYWCQIAGRELPQIMEPDVRGGILDGTVFVSIPHLSSRKKSMSYDLMRRLGEWIRVTLPSN